MVGGGPRLGRRLCGLGVPTHSEVEALEELKDWVCVKVYAESDSPAGEAGTGESCLAAYTVQ